MKCPNCGEKIKNTAKFCCSCGTSIPHNATQSFEVFDGSLSLVDQVKVKLRTMWNQLPIFYKVCLIAFLAITILFLVAYFVGNGFALFCSILQFVGIVIAILLKKGIIKTKKASLPYMALTASLLLSVLYVHSYSWNRTSEVVKEPVKNQPSIGISSNHYSDLMTEPELSNAPITTMPIETVSTTAFSPLNSIECIEQHYEKIVTAFKNAGFNTVSVEALSELGADNLDKRGEVVKIVIGGNETFNKDDEFSKIVPVVITYYDVKMVSAPIASNQVENIETEELVNLFKNAGFADVSVTIRNDIDPQYSQDTFRNQIFINGNQYFSTSDTFPVDSTVSIISHRREDKYKVTLNINFIPNFFFNKYGVDIEVGYKEVGTLSHGEDNSFVVWLDPGIHTITFRRSSYIRPETQFQFTIQGEAEITYEIICYEDSIHVELQEFIDHGAVGENEAMVPLSASDFKYSNYRNVESTLRNAGFTNIKTAILYDIIWGWTQEGEVDSVSISGKTDFTKGTVFSKDAEIIITYHMWQDDDPSRIKMQKSAIDYEGSNYTSVEAAIKKLGFSNIVLEQTETNDTSHKEGEVYRITIDGKHFVSGDTYRPEDKVLIKYYHVLEPTDESVYYSTNTKSTVKNGNSGIYAYKTIGGMYDIYWIIDFDEGYVFWFTDGNGDEQCDRLEIESGDLNSVLIITYHDGDTQWSNGLHFKWKNQPDHLVMQDHNGIEYDYYPTSLSSALAIRNSKRIKDY